MNIYDFEYKDNVKIRTKDDNVFFGTVINIEDPLEMDSEQAVVNIETESGIFGLLESEIKSIEIEFDKTVRKNVNDEIRCYILAS